MIKKAKSQRGESILETLVALIIIIFSFVFLTQAILSAGKINASVKKENIGFTYFDVKDDGTLEYENGSLKNTDQKCIGIVKLILSEEITVGETTDYEELDSLPTITFNVYSVRNYVINSSKPKYFIIEHVN